MILLENIIYKENDYNTIVKGVGTEYSFLSIGYSIAIKAVKTENIVAKNVICLASIMECNNSMNNNLVFADFYEDVSDFFDCLKQFKDIKNLYFKVVKSIHEADEIILDITNYHKNHIVNKGGRTYLL